MKIDSFVKTLEQYRKPKSSNPYDSNRITHCYLLHMHKGKSHIFEVRGWKELSEETLDLSVVNWTLCAGPASLTLKEDTVDNFVIVPDSEEVYKLKRILEDE